MKIFVTGATGMIGSRLVAALAARGDQVVALSRNAAAARQKFGTSVTVVEGDPTREASWMQAVAGCDGVVNLAGESLFARRWSDDFKRVIRESRGNSTRNVVAAIGQASPRPAVLVNGSAIGFYGFTGDEPLTEASPRGQGDFLSDVCHEWEKAAEGVKAHGTRLVLLRTGVVMDKLGGALKQMMLPFKMFAGGPVGSGKQWVSWIHHADEVGLILFALDQPKVEGPLNATAPNPVTNAELSKALGAALSRPSFMPTPAFALKTMLGEVADLVTKGQRVLPRKALDLGYVFQFSDVGPALKQIVAN